MPKVISTTYARDNFADIINQAAYVGDEFLVQKWGEPMVRIVPANDRKVAKAKKLDPGTAFALSLAKIRARGLPTDLAKNHDKYAWE